LQDLAIHFAFLLNYVTNEQTRKKLLTRMSSSSSTQKEQEQLSPEQVRKFTHMGWQLRNLAVQMLEQIIDSLEDKKYLKLPSGDKNLAEERREASSKLKGIQKKIWIECTTEVKPSMHFIKRYQHFLKDSVKYIHQARKLLEKYPGPEKLQFNEQQEELLLEVEKQDHREEEVTSTQVTTPLRAASESAPTPALTEEHSDADDTISQETGHIDLAEGENIDREKEYNTTKLTTPAAVPFVKQRASETIQDLVSSEEEEEEEVLVVHQEEHDYEAESSMDLDFAVSKSSLESEEEKRLKRKCLLQSITEAMFPWPPQDFDLKQVPDAFNPFIWDTVDNDGAPRYGTQESSCAFSMLLLLSGYCKIPEYNADQEGKHQAENSVVGNKEFHQAFHQLKNILFSDGKIEESIKNKLYDQINDGLMRLFNKVLGDEKSVTSMKKTNLDQEFKNVLEVVYGTARVYRMVCTKCGSKARTSWRDAVLKPFLTMFGVPSNQVNWQKVHVGKLRLPCPSCRSYGTLRFEYKNPPKYLLVNVDRTKWNMFNFSRYPLQFPDLASVPMADVEDYKKKKMKTIDLASIQKKFHAYRLAAIARLGMWVVPAGSSTCVATHWMMDAVHRVGGKRVWKRYSNGTISDTPLNPRTELPYVGLGYNDPDPCTGEVTFVYCLAEQSHLSDTLGDQEWSPSHKPSSWCQQVVDEECEAYGRDEDVPNWFRNGLQLYDLERRKL
jgi:hypothetical protein